MIDLTVAPESSPPSSSASVKSASSIVAEEKLAPLSFVFLNSVPTILALSKIAARMLAPLKRALVRFAEVKFARSESRARRASTRP